MVLSVYIYVCIYVCMYVCYWDNVLFILICYDFFVLFNIVCCEDVYVLLTFFESIFLIVVWGFFIWLCDVLFSYLS